MTPAVSTSISDSVARLALSMKVLRKHQKNSEAQTRRKLVETRSFPSPFLKVWPYQGIEMILFASPQDKALGRQRSGYLRQAHFITTSKKGGVNPAGQNKLTMILIENFFRVKKILLLIHERSSGALSTPLLKPQAPDRE
jgi:hypothetical protein